MLNGVLRSIAPQTPFPSVEAVSIKIVFRKDGPWGYPKTIYQEILEVELFGVPEKIVKITSPVSGSVGDGPFVAQFNWPLIPDYSEWGWYSLPSWNNSGVLVEGVSSFPKSNLPPGEYAFYYYCEASNGQYYEDWVYPVTIPGGSSLRITSPANGAVFSYGQEITFSGEAPQTVTNLEWFSDDVKIGEGLTTTKSNLIPGNHVITLKGLSNGSEVSATVNIVVGEPASIIIKNLDAQPSEEFPTTMAVSYRAAKTRFQAIGCRADGSKVGPVPVNWNLEGGGVDSNTMREKILIELDKNVGKIGVYETPTGAKKQVDDIDQVTFVSYLSSTSDSGNIRVIARRGALPKAEVSIRIKQPTISLKINKVSTIPSSKIIQKWKDKTVETWSAESILEVIFLNSSPDSIPNDKLSNPTWLPTSEEKGLAHFRKIVPDLEVILVNDVTLNLAFNNLPTITRQFEKLLSTKRGSNESITVAITGALINARITFKQALILSLGSGLPLDKLLMAQGGWGVSSRFIYKRDTAPQKIDDNSQAGIALVNIAGPSFDDWELYYLAHEVGHLLIRSEDDHFRANKTPWKLGNVMIQGKGSGPDVEAIQWVHALGLSDSVSAFVEER